MAINSRPPESGKPCGAGGTAHRESSLSPTPHPPPIRPRPQKYKRAPPGSCSKESNDTATLQRPSPLPHSPPSNGPASPICLSPPGALQVCTQAHQGAGQGRKFRRSKEYRALLERERAARQYSGLFPCIPENHCSPLPPNSPFPHMSHRGGYCYSVIWKSNSSLLSVPSPAIHKERTVQEWGRG